MMPQIIRESLHEYALTRTVKEILKNRLLTLWSLAIHLLDIGSDIWVARRHYKDGNYGYLSATLTFVIVPAIIASFFSLRWYCSDVKVRGKRKSKFLIILHCLHFGPVISYVKGYKYSTKSSDTTEGKIKLVFLMKQAYSDAASLRLIEAFMESIPQCILQIFIISSDHRHQTTVTPDATQVVSIWISLFSVAWSLAYHYEHLALRPPGRRSLRFLCFIWRLVEVGPRVVVLGLFASRYPKITGCLCLGRGLFMVVWILQKEEKEYAHKGLEKWLHIILVGWLFNFCCLAPPHAEVFQWMSAFYLITFVENLMVGSMWTHDYQQDTWIPIVTVHVLVLYLFGMAFLPTGRLYRKFAIQILTVQFRASYCEAYYSWRHLEEIWSAITSFELLA